MKLTSFTRLCLFTLVISLLFFQCSSPKSVVQTTEGQLFQQYIPVVVGLDNPVLEVRFETDTEQELKHIQVSIAGNEAMESIQVRQIVGEEKVPIAAMMEVSSLNTIQINRTLPSGSHSFLISVVPEEGASLLEKLEVGVPEVLLENQRVEPVVPAGIKPLRLAHKVRHHGDDGVHSYRIPGLATTTRGTLLAIYDIRRESSVDLQGDIDVGLSRSTDGGQTWERMKVIMDMKEWGDKPESENGIGDPSILVDPFTNTIWVMALWAHGKPGQMLWNSSEAGMTPEETGQLMLVKSEDDGVTWSWPINITSQMKDPKWKLMFNGPGKGITMKDGTLVFAGQYKDENNMPHSTIIYSKDRGETWQIGTGAKSNTTEAQVVELNDGSLMLNMRDNRGGARSVAVTSDLGATWTEHPSSRSALIEPVCMGSLITYPENRTTEDASWLFFSNPSSTDTRNNITIKASADQGLTWPEGHQVLLDEGTGWGYSCLTVIDEKHLGILYESSQANMTFQIIPLEEVVE
jgi:sialidase-1